MGTVSNFPSGLPDGGKQEFAEALWDSIPASIQSKFSSAEQVDQFLERVEEALEGTGLSVTSMSIGINPETHTATINLSAEFL